MLCEKCGTQVDDNLEKCSNCGADLSAPILDVTEPAGEETETTIENIRNDVEDNVSAPNTEKSRKFPLKIPIMAGIVVAILLFSAAFIFAMKSDMFKSPKQLYLQAEGDNAMNAINSIIENADKKYNEYSNSDPAENNIEFSGNANLGSLLGMDSSVSSNINELLNNLKVAVDTKSNPKEKQALYDFNISLKDNKLINGEIVKNKDVYALSVPALYSKYLVFNPNDINSLVQKTSGTTDSSTPKTLSSDELLKAIKFDKEDLVKLIENYGKTLGDSISDKQVTLDKDVDFKVNDLTIKCKKMTLSMDKTSFDKLISNLLDKAKDDDLLYSLTAQNVINIMKLMNDSGYKIGTMSEIQSDLSKDKFKNGISELNNTLKDTLKKIEMPDGIKMSIYVDGDKIIGRTIETKLKSTESNETISISYNTSQVLKYKNRNIFNCDLTLSDDGSGGIAPGLSGIEAKLGYDTTINDDKDTETGKMSMVVDVKGDNFSASVLTADVRLDFGKGAEPDSRKYVYDYNITAGIPMSQQFSAKGKIDIDSWTKEKEKNQGSNVSFSIDLGSTPSSSVKFSGTTNVKTESTKGIEFKLPDINKDNSIEIAKASPEDLNAMYAEVMQSLQKLATDNPDIMKMLMGQ